ncbi:hypothetical protein HQP42_08985 [Rhodococcus fascians]|jgi:hypothetical protein|nr:hypothetical protein [Rhodococcus fascians]MBY3825494.1 hypothetical protein [Rhodococcus fascians]MBY3835956.1 hypothetical protein [Rhodococcus fascians]MBY3865168.1 hypothetical protein [Rhodococcus fascians]MBY3884430.1 hypothetical protein [Rhodococcus fascians]
MQWMDLPDRSARFNDLMRQTYELLNAAAKLCANEPVTESEATELNWIAIHLCDLERLVGEETVRETTVGPAQRRRTGA